eukprot:919453-Amphidinium_carterae.1
MGGPKLQKAVLHTEKQEDAQLVGQRGRWVRKEGRSSQRAQVARSGATWRPRVHVLGPGHTTLECKTQTARVTALGANVAARVLVSVRSEDDCTSTKARPSSTLGSSEHKCKLRLVQV